MCVVQLYVTLLFRINHNEIEESLLEYADD